MTYYVLKVTNFIGEYSKRQKLDFRLRGNDMLGVKLFNCGSSLFPIQTFRLGGLSALTPLEASINVPTLEHWNELET